jgi:hypothetical protein
LYASAEAGKDTLIRVQHGADESPPRQVKVGPERRYPGRLILPDADLPDFNGDGYVDLLLWSTPEPGTSLDALTKVVAVATWPLRITAHLFSPDKGRYEPKVAGHTFCRLPVPWFLTFESGTPLRNCVLADFDGDGRTDCAWSTTPDSFSIWLYKDGLRAKPDFHSAFPEAISRVEFQADLDGQGRTAVGLRGSSNLYLISAGL